MAGLIQQSQVDGRRGKQAPVPDVDRYQSRVEDRSSCAASFARYGDERAIPVLADALAGAKYREYTAMCEAIEALGGPEQPRRSFVGDPDYEAVRKEKEEQRKKNAGE